MVRKYMSTEDKIPSGVTASEVSRSGIELMGIDISMHKKYTHTYKYKAIYEGIVFLEHAANSKILRPMYMQCSFK